MEQVFVSWTRFEKYLIFLFVIFLAVAVANLLHAIVRRFLDHRWKERYSKFVARLVEYSVLIGGFYFGIYHVLKLDIGALAASFGIISVAIAFSSQQIVQNMIAGVIISIKRPIWYEDWVELSTTGLCKVKDIALTQVLLRGIDGRLFYVPNSLLLSSIVTNYSRGGFLECTLAITLPFHTDFDKVKLILRRAVEQNPYVFPEVSEAERREAKKITDLPVFRKWLGQPPEKTLSPRILLSNINENKLTIQLRFWIRQVYRKEQIVSDLLEGIWNQLKEAGVRTG